MYYASFADCSCIFIEPNCFKYKKILFIKSVLESYKLFLDLMWIFVTNIFFKIVDSKIRITEIDERTLQNWRSLEIGEVCTIPEESGGFGEYHPNVTLFSDLLSKLDFIVKNMFCYNESKTFHTVMKNTAKLHRRSAKIQFDDVIDTILIPTTDTWDKICIKMKTGSISVCEIEKYCFNDFNDLELYDELVAMNRGRKENWIKDRITQLQRFQMFSKTVSVAKLLLRVREEYDIGGSFENLELIAKSVKICFY